MPCERDLKQVWLWEPLSGGRTCQGRGKAKCKAPEAGAAAQSRTGEERKRQRRQDKVRRTRWGTSKQECAGPTDELWLGNGFWKVALSHIQRKLRVRWQRRTSQAKCEKAVLGRAHTHHRKTLAHRTTCHSRGLQSATTTNVHQYQTNHVNYDSTMWRKTNHC